MEEENKMMYPFRRRVKEYVQSTDKLSLIGLTFHAGESYWGIHPYNYHIDDFTPLLPWNISKSSGIDWMEIELVNILFSLLQLGTTVHKFSPNSDFQYLKEQTGGCFHWHQCWDSYRTVMHNVAVEPCCCVYWPVFIVERISHIVNGMFISSSVSFRGPLCGSAWSVCCDESGWGQQ